MLRNVRITLLGNRLVNEWQNEIKNEMISEIQEENTELIETVEKRVLELCRSNLKGITERHIREDQPDLTPTVRMKVINSLLASGKLELCKQGSTLVYRLVCLVCLFVCLFIYFLVCLFVCSFATPMQGRETLE